MTDHVHKPTQVSICGKADTFVAECECGEAITAGTWWRTPPAGWSVDSWTDVAWAAHHLLRAWDNFGHDAAETLEP